MAFTPSWIPPQVPTTSAAGVEVVQIVAVESGTARPVIIHCAGHNFIRADYVKATVDELRRVAPQ